MLRNPVIFVFLLILGVSAMIYYKIPADLGFSQGEAIVASEYAWDSEGSLGLDPLSPREWHKNEKKTLTFGIQSKPLWLRFAWEKKQVADAFLHIGNPLLDQVSVYVLNQNQELVYKTSLGDQMPFKNRSLQSFPLNTQLSLPLGRYEFYLRIDSHGSYDVPLQVFSSLDYSAFVANLNLVQGFFLGCSLIMIGYNLFLYFSIRKIYYLHYIAFVGGYAFFQMAMQGISFQYLFPEQPTLHHGSIVVALIFVNCFYVLFSVSFLGLPPKSWLARPLWMILILTLSLGLLTPWLQYTQQIYYLSIVSVVLPPLLLLTAFLVYRKGRKTARYYILGWTCYSIGSVAFGLAKLGLIEATNFALHAQQIAATLECLFMSLALADTFNEAKAKIEQQKDELLVSLQALEKANLEKESEAKLKVAIAAKVTHFANNPLQVLTGVIEFFRDLLEPLPAQQTAGKQALFLAHQTLADGKEATLKLASVIDELRVLSGVHGLAPKRLIVAEFWDKVSRDLMSSFYHVQCFPIQESSLGRHEFFAEAVILNRSLYYVLSEIIQSFHQTLKIEPFVAVADRDDTPFLTLSLRLVVPPTTKPVTEHELALAKYLLAPFFISLALEKKGEEFWLSLSLPMISKDAVSQRAS